MVSEKIRKLRIERNMTQRQVAKALNLCTSTVGMYEQGRRTPNIDVIIAYAKLFAVTTDDLLRGSR